MSRFLKKVAIVTGASKGIGAAVAKRLAAEGASVVVNYSSSKEGGDRVVAEIEKAGGKAIAVGASVGKEAEVAKLFEEAKKAYGRVDILVNNAGVFAVAPLEGVSVSEFNRHFDTNVLGLLLATKAALPLFPASGGVIINIGSVVSTLAPPNGSVYVGTKGAVDSITKSLAKELAGRKIRVNGVNPGMVVTEGTHAAGMVGTEFETAMLSITPLGRLGQPEDIASAVAFLASEDASWITGESLVVSGGGGM
ncbi:glucose 1-dehydrogenase [Mesorhizobium sp. VK23B]|uniref:Glucose 1-dehydrogenase n=1 Tax=Mesorhizobium dulcispinae TaxID=3072316 RepID=A0ABU4XQ10_9HYPH|nr:MULTISPECIES: glucose 1-dehydrogenase [unclassified Mesorhizobium]MDX8470287.1 glucose 1-dehydrogenase [Mesorhizobium sp. VK23B]MDX8476658.1 glucose 1-dehydrogenase [Mesorhizobium sp. VK23A]